jgi:hypothetical protein
VLFIGTIFFYGKVSIAFAEAQKHKPSDSLHSLNRETITESLIEENMHRQYSLFGQIYSKIKVRFHVFFILMILTLGLRLFFYLIVRVPKIFSSQVEDITTHVISAERNIIIGAQEIIMNFVLLCYFYGLNSESSSGEGPFDKEFDQMIEEEFSYDMRHSVLGHAALKTASGSLKSLYSYSSSRNQGHSARTK